MSLYYLYCFDKKLIMEKLSAYSSGLHHTNIKPIESYVVVNQKFNDPKTFALWHDMLGHPGCNTPKYTLVIFNLFNLLETTFFSRISDVYVIGR